jgi:hypothetical protein
MSLCGAFWKQTFIIRKNQQLIRIAANESGLSNPCCIAHHVHCKNKPKCEGHG